MASSSTRPTAHGHGLDRILGPMTSYTSASGQAPPPPHAYMLSGISMRPRIEDGSGSTSSGGAGLQYGRDKFD